MLSEPLARVLALSQAELAEGLGRVGGGRATELGLMLEDAASAHLAACTTTVSGQLGTLSVPYKWVAHEGGYPPCDPTHPHAVEGERASPTTVLTSTSKRSCETQRPRAYLPTRLSSLAPTPSVARQPVQWAVWVPSGVKGGPKTGFAQSAQGPLRGSSPCCEPILWPFCGPFWAAQ